MNPSVKDRSPRVVKDLANTATRAWGLATARWRPWPDFLIVGTKRGGTTSMWNYLVGHPQVVPMFPGPRGLKSNEYFFRDLDRGDRWYRSHFHTRTWRRRRERQVGRTVTGEASPYYMYGPHQPRLIAERMPGVRLIVLLRDPVDRAYGHHRERTRAGVETLSFEEALAAEPERLAGEHERMAADPGYYSEAHDFFSYRDRGIYLPQLQRLEAHFPPEQLFVMRSEAIYEDEQAAFDRVCDFLRIDQVPLEDPRRHNHVPQSPIDPATRDELVRFYAPHNEALYAHLGRDLGWARP